MQSEQPNSLFRNLRVTTENHTDLRASQHAKPDTRRFAAIFPLEAPEAVSVDCGNATHEEYSEDSGDPSRWELVAALDESAFTTQAASLADVDERSTSSAAQQIIACYRAVHGSNHEPESATLEIKQKKLPRISDDQRSMYTLAAPVDPQSTMDMMWRPKPKVRMRRADQRALIQAQSQAIAMMHSAGLKHTNKIQCRRRGCADILPGVESLKYHLHIHNIADTAGRCDDTSSSAVREPSLVEASAPHPKTSKRSHFRSKSSRGTQHKRSTTYSATRKLSAVGSLPSLFSPRESTPEVEHVPNLTTVAKTFVSDPNLSKSAGLPPVPNNDETPSSHTPTPPRGRRTRKESMAVTVGAECSPSIAMLLSPPSSPNTHGDLMCTPCTKSPTPLMLNPAMDDENNTRAVTPNENPDLVSEMLTRSRSPLRALSPSRAMSPIRNGIRRVLSIGYSVDFTDK